MEGRGERWRELKLWGTRKSEQTKERGGWFLCTVIKSVIEGEKQHFLKDFAGARE